MLCPCGSCCRVFWGELELVQPTNWVKWAGPDVSSGSACLANTKDKISQAHFWTSMLGAALGKRAAS